MEKTHAQAEPWAWDVTDIDVSPGAPPRVEQASPQVRAKQSFATVRSQTEFGNEDRYRTGGADLETSPQAHCASPVRGD
jgi:hypothetical protein